MAASRAPYQCTQEPCSCRGESSGDTQPIRLSQQATCPAPWKVQQLLVRLSPLFLLSASIPVFPFTLLCPHPVITSPTHPNVHITPLGLLHTPSTPSSLSPSLHSVPRPQQPAGLHSHCSGIGDCHPPPFCSNLLDHQER